MREFIRSSISLVVSVSPYFMAPVQKTSRSIITRVINTALHDPSVSFWSLTLLHPVHARDKKEEGRWTFQSQSGFSQVDWVVSGRNCDQPKTIVFGEERRYLSEINSH
jgi:hypothetical protein